MTSRGKPRIGDVVVPSAAAPRTPLRGLLVGSEVVADQRARRSLPHTPRTPLGGLLMVGEEVPDQVRDGGASQIACWFTRFDSAAALSTRSL